MLAGVSGGLLVGCHSDKLASSTKIEITHVPSANPGGPVQMGFIEGRVTGAKPGQSVVLYAYSQLWWIQPFASQQYTRVQPDSTWRNSTHLGTQYAALLVDAGYHPPTKITNLPSTGNGVNAVAIVAGAPDVPVISKTLHFSGYDWTVRTVAGDRGGRPNVYDPANAWVDESGYLHLRMAPRDGVWTCAEVSLTRSLGYGSYSFLVQDVGHLGPSDALSLYIADDLRLDNVRSELDIEMSRWGIAGAKNAQYVVQPFYVPENMYRFIAPGGVLTSVMDWEPGRASFKTVRGAGANHGTTVVSEHTFESSVPTPAREKVHIGLYSYNRAKDLPQQPVEVVIEKFQFLP